MYKFSVYKFGGTSVGSSEIILRATQIIKNTKNKVLVVVSAMGGTTDKLLMGAKQAALGDLSHSIAAAADYRFRHAEAINSLIKDSLRRGSLERYLSESADEFQSICSSLKVLRDYTSRIMDVTVARGERMMARIVSAALEEQGSRCAFIDATEIISVERRAGAMVPNMQACEKAAREKILPLFERLDVVVIPGFIGCGPDNEVVTLGRGGSDYSSTILAACINAETVTLFKEVDGLLTTDPKFVKNARVIPQLHYREATELAYYGAKVLHPRTIIPLLEKKIPLVVKNSFNPEYPGTIICGEMPKDAYPVKALTAIKGQTLITVEGNAMMGVPGIAARIFSALAQKEISISVISQASSEANICFIVPEDEAGVAVDTLNDAFQFEIEHRQVNPVMSTNNLAVVAVVGMGMKGTPGIAARTFSSLARQQINVVAIAQGSSELNISFVIPEADLQKALTALHDEYQLDKLRALPNRVSKQVEVSILGFGQIGMTLARQIAGQNDYLRRSMGITCLCVGIADRSGLDIKETGFTSADLEDRIKHKKTGSRLFPTAKILSLEAIFQELKSRIFKLPVNKGILADLTAEETAPMILDAIRQGFHIVLANKKALAVNQELYDELFATANSQGITIRYEATVGAGLPILDTIEKLESSGDQISEITGCLSGTLGYLMTRLEDGILFSQAVKEAHAAGYTEPDPRDDLSGMDVARKGLILMRRLGYRINLKDIQLEPLFPPNLSHDNAEIFIEGLKALDDDFTDRLRRAAVDHCVLRYVARLSGSHLSVGIESIPQSSPLGRLRGTGNQVTIKTKRYDTNPLIVAGPGAGAEVTAAGVLNDIIAIASAENIHRSL
jgi:aspartokinase/homoserine dehydrogenase 1